jgi:outer membrane receptor protein involved in Fe transport
LTTRHALRRAAFGSTALTAAISALIAAAPAAAQTARPINIPAGPLDAALLALAAQTHEQLFYAPDMVAGRRTVAVSGALTVEQALGRMAPDVMVSRQGPGVVVLKAAAPSAAAGAAAPSAGPTATGAAGGRPFAADPPGGGQAAPGPQGDPPPRAAAPTAAGPVSTVKEVVVTGSHIRGAPPASPLVVMTRADLERSGQSTLAAALQQLPQNFAGGAAEGNGTTGGDRLARNTNYGTAVNLRGLGNNATLVLINGRRMSGSGALGDFADLSVIPNSAVERVEVLLDGASAVYGSDAVGGVVNVILRRPFDGAETRLEGGASTSGAPTEFQASQTIGRRWAGGGIVASYEYQQRSALPGADRDFAASADLRPLGGSDQRLTLGYPGNILTVGAGGVLAPSFAIPAGQNGVGLTPGQLLPGVVNRENQRQGVDLFPRQTLQSVYLSGEQALGGRLQLSADARYSRRTYRIRLAPATASFSVTRANPYFVSPTGGASVVVGYSFLGDLPNPVASGSVESLGFNLGGTLKLAGDWRAEAYLTYARDTEASDVRNLVNSGALNEATGTLPDNPATPFSTAQAGFFNPFTGLPGSNRPAVLAFIGSGFGTTAYRDLVTSANLQVDGTVWELPGGPLKLALGAQARRETFNRAGVNFIATAAPVPVVGSNLARSVAAAFAELRAPLFGPDNARPGLQRLELTLAGRVERYSDAGTTGNPQVGVVWEPTSDLRLRGTYGTSFRAPGLRELGDAQGYGAGLLSEGATRVRVLQLAGGNPGLRPETAISFTTGADWRPQAVPGLTLSATWFDIKYRSRIDRPVAASVVGALNDPALANFVTRIAPATNAADLARITALIGSPLFNTGGGIFPATDYGAIIDSRYVNTASLHVRGLDLSGSYSFDLAGDHIRLAGAGTYSASYDQQLTPTSPVLDKVGVAGFPVRLRSRITADWTRGRLTVGGAFNYISSYRDPLGAHIGDHPTFDLQVRLAPAPSGPFAGLSATLNVRNLFDRAPPFYNNSFGIGYDPTNADPIGRFVSLQLTKAW